MTKKRDQTQPTNGPEQEATQQAPVMAQVVLKPDGGLFLAIEEKIDDRVGFCLAVGVLAINAAAQMRAEEQTRSKIAVAPPGMKVPRVQQ